MFRLIVAAATALALGGCSFGMRPVGSSNPATAPTCNPDSAAPGVDLLGFGVVGLSGLMAAFVLEQSNCGDGDDECGTVNAGVATMAVLASGVYLYSSISGFDARSRCRQAHETHADWLNAGRPGAPGAVEQDREARKRAICDRWRAELAAATSNAQKLSVAQRRPAHCL